MYKYEAGSKMKEASKRKKTVVPLCAPVCCALPCTIMWKFGNHQESSLKTLPSRGWSIFFIYFCRKTRYEAFFFSLLVSFFVLACNLPLLIFYEIENEKQIKHRYCESSCILRRRKHTINFYRNSYTSI